MQALSTSLKAVHAKGLKVTASGMGSRPERSNTLALRLIVWVALTLGAPPHGWLSARSVCIF
jgi:hypothetical protein